MFTPDLQSEFYFQLESEANFDQPQQPDPEGWQVLLAEMKKAILNEETEKARKLMYGLEYKIIDATMKAFSDGFAKGTAPLPF